MLAKLFFLSYQVANLETKRLQNDEPYTKKNTANAKATKSKAYTQIESDLEITDDLHVVYW